MPGEPLVDERVVRGQQIDDVAILAHDAFEEQFRLAPETLPQLVVPVGIEHAVRRGRRQIPQVQQLLRRSFPPARRIEDRRACAAPAARAPSGLLQPSLAGHVDQLVVRNAAPQEERQARGQFQVADAIGSPGGEIGRFLFGAHEKLRARQQPPKRQLDAVLERAGAAALLVEASSTPRDPAQSRDADRRAAPASTGSASRRLPPGWRSPAGT